MFVYLWAEYDEMSNSRLISWLDFIYWNLKILKIKSNYYKLSWLYIVLKSKKASYNENLTCNCEISWPVDLPTRHPWGTVQFMLLITLSVNFYYSLICRQVYFPFCLVFVRNIQCQLNAWCENHVLSWLCNSIKTIYE
jgi:hypothetical protein